MLIAWGVASNRCAFAALVLKAPAAAEEIHSCCQGTQDGGDQAPTKQSSECCQKLGAPMLENNTELVKGPVPVALLELAWLVVATSLVEKGGERVQPTVGPPKALSFAEVVLQRSVLCHAPPTAV